MKSAQLHKSCPNISKVLSKPRPCAKSNFTVCTARESQHPLFTVDVVTQLTLKWLVTELDLAGILVRLIAVLAFWALLDKILISWSNCQNYSLLTALCISFIILHFVRKKGLILSGVKYSLCLLAWCPKKSQIASFPPRRLAFVQLQSTEPQVMRGKSRNNNAFLHPAVVSNIRFTLRPYPHQAFDLQKLQLFNKSSPDKH